MAMRFHAARWHYMADMQDDPHEELLWDRRALDAAGSIAGSGAREYYPSLHLNLAEGYRKLGDWSAAREHLARARELAGALPANGYGDDPAGDCGGSIFSSKNEPGERYQICRSPFFEY